MLGPVQIQRKWKWGFLLKALQLLCDATRRLMKELQSYTQDCVESSSIMRHTWLWLTSVDSCCGRRRSRKILLKANFQTCCRCLFMSIIELYPSETLDLITKEMMSIPCWMLIGWISQWLPYWTSPKQ
ncbi:hypothetical protein KUCAC02_017615 [Chaenocephalus aceratus]|uniref:Uncharacterized protein n=1 Tax=Chaenocephalus aceratus TaxID=36190 RepID=A0ACB9W2V7_CHAAC|nr:hypothetical protein KUCAC02_017615 [Chaenocephalus aceratus]